MARHSGNGSYGNFRPCQDVRFTKNGPCIIDKGARYKLYATIHISHSSKILSVRSSAQPAAAWPEELSDLVGVPPFLACLADLGVHSLADFGENVDLEEVSHAERAPHSRTGIICSHCVRVVGPRPDHASGA